MNLRYIPICPEWVALSKRYATPSEAYNFLLGVFDYATDGTEVETPRTNAKAEEVARYNGYLVCKPVLDCALNRIRIGSLGGSAKGECKARPGNQNAAKGRRGRPRKSGTAVVNG